MCRFVKMKKTISSKDLMVTAYLVKMPSDYSAAPGNKPNFTNFDKLLDNCDINGNNTLFFFEERQQHT